MELIVVVLILALLAAVAVVGYDGVTDRAQDARTVAELSQIATAVVAGAALDDDGLIDRDDVRAVLLQSAPDVVDGIGPVAASSWQLGYAGESPSAPGQVSAGFLLGDGTVTDVGGSTAALVASSSSGHLFAVTIRSANSAANANPNAGPGNNNAGGNCAGNGKQGAQCTVVAEPPVEVAPGSTAGDVLTGGEVIPVPTPAPTPTPTPITPLTVQFTQRSFDSIGGTLTPAVLGGTGTKVFSMTSTLPSGVTFDPATGALTAEAAATRTEGHLDQVDLGATHGAALSSGALYTWGQNSYGQLGLGTTTDAHQVPTAVSVAGKRVTQVAAGANHTVALTSDGVVYTWGQNTNGQLGNGTTAVRTSPGLVTTVGTPMAGKTIVAVAAGVSQTFAVASDGSVYAWGLNTNGRLGDGSTTQRTTPVAVVTAATAMAGKTIKAVAAGDAHTLALASDGTVYSWGLAAGGRLGAGVVADTSKPIAVTTAGTPLAGKTVTQISAGADFSAVLTSDGTVDAFGTNRYGTLGDGTATDRTTAFGVKLTGSPMDGKIVTYIDAGKEHTLARTSDGNVYAWGTSYGLGQYDGLMTSNVPLLVDAGTGVLAAHQMTVVAAGSDISAALDTNGALYEWGVNVGPTGAITRPYAVPLKSAIDGRQVVQIAASDRQTLMLDDTGRLYGSGSGISYGQGSGAVTDPSVPTLLNVTGTPLDGKHIVQVAAGSQTSYALDADGVMYAWGVNSNGQVGDGTTTKRYTPVTVVTAGTPLEGKKVTQIAAYNLHVLALTSDGRVYAWGNNAVGQLGDGTLAQRNAPVAVAVTGTPMDGKTIIEVAVGTDHSVALASDGTAYSWGQGANWRLGTGTSTSQSKPAAVVTTGALAGKALAHISAGSVQTLAVSTDGLVFGWGGDGVNQQIGTNSGTVYNPTLVSKSGSVLAGKTITSISTGTGHTVALGSDGTLYAWGAGSKGQIGDGTSTMRPTPVVAGTVGTSLVGKAVVALLARGDLTVALTANGQVHGWGDASEEALGTGQSSGYITSPQRTAQGPGVATSQFPFSAQVTVTDDSGSATTGQVVFTLN